MKMLLTNEGINQVCLEIEERIRQHVGDKKEHKKEIMRNRLMIEEVLLKYQKELGEDVQFEYIETKRFGRLGIKIVVFGKEFDPFANSDDEAVLHRLLQNAGQTPCWNYRNNSNQIVVTIQKKLKISYAVKVLMAIAAGILLGFAVKQRPGTANFMAEDVLGPVFDTILGVLMAFALIQIFLSVVNGICEMGDVSTFYKIGRKLLVRLLLLLAVIDAVMLVVFSCIFKLSSGGGKGFEFQPIYELILKIVPHNIIDPFLQGDSLQIIFIAVCLGIGLLVLGDTTAQLQRLLYQTNLLIQQIVMVIVQFVPVVIFISIFRIVALNQLSTIVSSYKYIIFNLLTAVFITGIGFFSIVMKQKVSPKRLIAKGNQPFLISLFTGSSSAAFTDNVNVCQKEFGIDEKLVKMGLPLSQIFFKPGCMAQLICIGFCMSEMYHVSINITTVVTIGILSYLLSIAIPTVSGGSAICYMLLLRQIGVPEEALAIVLALDFAIEGIQTADSVVMIQAELIRLADKMELLDKKKLRG